MKKLLFTLLIVTLVIAVTGQGTENFDNYPETGSSYKDGTFPGQDGSTWTYKQCRGDSVIIAPSPTLGKNRTPTAEVISGTLHNGCGILSFQYKQVFSSDVNLDIFVNGLLIHTVTTSGEQGVVKNSGDILVNISGDFTLNFKQKNTSSGQVCIDNITWTAHAGTILPEPSNYPTAFAANPGSYSVTLTWTDAAGTQPPTAYLIKGSTQNNITLPVDGVPIPDDPNLADGAGALNILQGAGSCTFSNLNSNTPYYFKIFPYTNTGADINYKTDGTPPSANATTPNTVVINSVNFDDYSFSDWTTFNVTGEQVWVIDSIHGVNGTGCAKMSGYANSASNQNEDWLISPAMNFDTFVNENLTFMSATKYAGPALEVMISNEYDGQGDPGNFDWILLQASLSAGNWVWTPSGTVNLSSVQGNSVYVAFRYTSTSTESATWEVDDVVITGDFPTAVKPSLKPSGFSLIPNPTRGKCTLKTSLNGMYDIVVLSSAGQEVYRITTGTPETEMNLEKLPKGVYFIRIIHSGTQDIPAGKVVLF